MGWGPAQREEVGVEGLQYLVASDAQHLKKKIERGGRVFSVSCAGGGRHGQVLAVPGCAHLGAQGIHEAMAFGARMLPGEAGIRAAAAQLLPCFSKKLLQYGACNLQG